jgi:hypothetical protein
MMRCLDSGASMMAVVSLTCKHRPSLRRSLTEQGYGTLRLMGEYFVVSLSEDNLSDWACVVWTF